MRSALSEVPNRICISVSGRKDINFPKRHVLQLFRIPDDGQSPQTQLFCVMHPIATTLSILFVGLLD
jgi:hypothetical protein